MTLKHQRTVQDETLIKNYMSQYDVNKIPEGHATYQYTSAPRTEKARLLRERHEQTRQEYRDLITHGFKKREIATLMKVSEAQVRKAANNVGLINELRGCG